MKLWDVPSQAAVTTFAEHTDYVRTRQVAPANPHLVLAGLLATGAHAIAAKAPLLSGDCAKPVAMMSNDEKAALGVQNAGRLPTTIDQARKNFGADKVLRGALGEEFVNKYLAVNEVSCFVTSCSVLVLMRLHRRWRSA